MAKAPSCSDGASTDAAPETAQGAPSPAQREAVEQARRRLAEGDAEGALAVLAPFGPEAAPVVSLIAARAHAAMGRAGLARARLEEALEHRPGNPDLGRECARLRLAEGDPRGAAALLAPLAEASAAPTLALLARAAAEAGEPGLARTVLERGLERFPDDPALTDRLASLHQAAGRSREAADLLARIEGSASPAQRLRLVRALAVSGEAAAADAALRRAADCFPEDWPLIEKLAEARLEAGDPRGALALLDRIVRDRSVQWFSFRAQIFEAMGDVAGFEAVVRQGLELYPDDLSLLSDLSKILAAQGRPEEARDVGARISATAVETPRNLARFVSVHCLFGDAPDAADLVSRLVARLEGEEGGRDAAASLIDLIPAVRLMAPDLGLPILKRILARLTRPDAVYSVNQQLQVATAAAAAGDTAEARRRVADLAQRVERAKDIIETMSLAAWTSAAPEIGTLAARLRAAPSEERSPVDGASPFAAAEVFTDPDLGALGFAVGGAEVAILFPGFYTVPGPVQSVMVQGLIARGVDVIRLFDLRRDVFLSGVGPACLDRTASARGYGRTVCVGTSGGGMPAALYGDAIGADRVVVFSTGTWFPPYDDPVERRARSFLERVHRLGLSAGTENLAIWRAPGPHPRLHIHYRTGNPQDAHHALRMKGVEGVTLHPVATASHNAFTPWSARAFADAVAPRA